jgi:hypothetical protein
VVRLVHGTARVLAAQPLVVREQRAQLGAHGGGGGERHGEVLSLQVVP